MSKYHRFVQESVDSLTDTGLDSVQLKTLLVELSVVVPRKGVSLKQLNHLLDIVLDTSNTRTFKNAAKLKMVKDSMWCYELVDFDTVLKILGCFKIDTGKDVLPKRLQSALSHWLVVNMCNLRWDKRCLQFAPYIFNLLTVGYLRPNLSLFLAYILELGQAVIDPRFRLSFFVNTYKLSILCEMLRKETAVLPLALVVDGYLNRADTEDMGLESWHSKLRNMIEISGEYEFEIDERGMSVLSDIREGPDSDFHKNRSTFVSLVESLNSRYGKRSPGAKRRKLDDVEFSTSSLVRLPQTQFTTVHSYCDEIHKPIQTPLMSLLKYVGTTKRSLYPLVDFLLKADRTTLDAQLQNIPSEGDMQNFVDRGLAEIAKYSMHVPKNSSLFPYLPLCKWGELQPEIAKLEQSALKTKSLASLAKSIVSLLECWTVRMEMGQPTDDVQFWYCVNNSIERVTRFFLGNCFSLVHPQLSDELAFLRVLQFTHTLPFDRICMSNVVLSPALTYSMFFSGSPILMDYLCRHVAYCKKYYAEYGSKYIENRVRSKVGRTSRDVNAHLSVSALRRLKEIHNSYVMDICNILWRDRAFERTDGSTAKGFMIPETFISKVMQLRFHYESATSDPRREYNLFYGPTFSSLVTAIIRSQEDQNSVSVRLQGPLNEEEYNKLKVGWVNSGSYDEFRALILDRLHDMGFAGLANLLFASLKSLFTLRQSKTPK